MDRVCVPRDMPIWSARRLREALKTVSESNGNTQDPDISVEPRIFNNGIQHRKDQDPKYFKRQQPCSQPSERRNFAVERVLEHKDAIIKDNPIDDEKVEQALRAAVTYMMAEKITDIPKGSEIGNVYEEESNKK